MSLLLLFFYQTSFNISSIQDIYKQSLHYDESSKKYLFEKYSTKSNYADLERLVIYKKSTGFQSPEFKLWASLEDAIFLEDSAAFKASFQNLERSYARADKAFIMGYYQWTNKIVFQKNFSRIELDSILLTLDSKPAFKSAFLHELLYSLSVQQRFDQNYIKLVKMKFACDKSLSPKLRNSNYSYLYNYIRFGGVYELAGLFLHFAKDQMFLKFRSDSLQRNSFVTDLMELNYDKGYVEKNIQLVNELYKNLLTPSEKEYIKFFLGQEKQVSLRDINDPYIRDYLNFKTKFAKMLDAIKLKHVINIPIDSLSETYVKNIEELAISYHSILGNIEDRDRLYKAHRSTFLREVASKTAGFLTTNKVFSSSHSIDYINSQKNLNYAIDELLIYQAAQYKSILNNNNRMNLELQNSYYKLLDVVDSDSATDDAFLNLAFQEELVLGKNTLKNLDAISAKDLFSKLQQDEVLLISIKGFGDAKIYILNRDQLIRSVNELEDEDFGKLSQYQKITIFDPQNIITQSFCEDFTEVNGIVPNVHFVSNLYEIENLTKTVEIKQARFLGTSQAFEFKDNYYPKLYYAQNEYAILNDYVKTDTTYSSSEINSEMYLLSGHFILSNRHPIFNRVAISVDENKRVVTMPSYHLMNNKNEAAKFVFLNACQSGKGEVYDGFSGQQQYGQYLLNSGVKAVIVAKKDIDDKTATIFLKQLLDGLDQGFLLSEAVQKAKTYIFNNVNSNPAFWDVYEVYGENFQVKFNKSFSVLSITFGLVGILLMVFLVKRLLKNLARI
jgi:hypothetical protein